MLLGINRNSPLLFYSAKHLDSDAEAVRASMVASTLISIRLGGKTYAETFSPFFLFCNCNNRRVIIREFDFLNRGMEMCFPSFRQ